MAESGINPPQPPPPSTNNAQRTKRSRVQFSCTACRYRKLKCDRTHPCDRCTRRGDAASCTYVGHGPRSRSNHSVASDPSHIQDRIQHLENLILSFAQKRRQEDDDGRGAAGTDDVASNPVTNGGHDGNVVARTMQQNANTNTNTTTPLEDSPGKLVNNEKVGITYVDASHWQAILDDLKEVKEYVQVDGEYDDDDTMENGDSLNGESPDDIDIDIIEHNANRPTLLFHGGRVPTKQEILADLPDRATMDRLIGRFLNSGDPTLSIIHVPSFLKQYDQFCNDPNRVSLPWLAFLYGCMALSVGMFRRALEQLPAPLGDAADEISRFERNCCYCLLHSNYTTVGKYKVEALLVYATIEYTKRSNSAMSVSIILGITIKLAMQMGYHRDAKHYNNISALEGEMRRRAWTVICQLDTLTAFQAGIPKQTQHWQSDTEPPRNIFDADFDENTVDLPPSQPDSVFTEASYLISKSRVMAAFGQISDLAYSRHPVNYEKVLEIDRRLEEAHELIAPPLRMRPLSQSVTDSSGLMMKRYTLDVLYQKARIVLHRKYLVEARYNPRLSYSRGVCVNAAKETLRHQYDLFQESQPGGRFDKDNWFFRTLQNHDFVLAAMVICLELFKHNDIGSPAGQQQQQQQQQPSPASPAERDNLIEILRNSREIWRSNLKYSVEARKAFSALTIMLKKAEIDDEARKRNSASPGQQQRNGYAMHQITHLVTRDTPPDVLRTTNANANANANANMSLGDAASDDQGAYYDNLVPPSMDLNIPTPPMSSSSGQSQGNNSATLQQQPSISPDDIFQQYPDLQFSLPELDVIQNMLDTPQNLDWHVWDDQMQNSGDRDIMNELWNPDADTIEQSSAVQLSNGDSQMDIRNDHNGNGSSNDIRSITNMSGLYWTTGCRG